LSVSLGEANAVVAPEAEPTAVGGQPRSSIIEAAGSTACVEGGDFMERRELVSPRTRRAFREHLVGWPLRAIQDLFENEGLQPGQGSPAVTGQRRSLVERYYATVNWTSPQEVGRVLRAYEHVLADADLPAPAVGELRRHLEWDGYRMEEWLSLFSPMIRDRQTGEPGLAVRGDPLEWRGVPWRPRVQ
jgi:hypothetical protein